VPSWQAEADLAAGHLVRLLADYQPAPVPLHLMFQPSRLASPTIWAFVDYLVEHWRGVGPPGAQARVDR
jgi:DNA-binding transcriptional LysR family regulator